MVRSVHDRSELAELLGKDPALHAYELGDLDDFFWPYTTWYREGEAVALLYHGTAEPTLIALAEPEPLRRLLTAITPLLPHRFYAHLSSGGRALLAERFAPDPHVGGPHLKMALRDRATLTAAPAEGEPLDASDHPELEALYAAAYPDNWFDARMLETGQYVGARRDGRLVAVAGIHVWSPAYRVAALGNVTALPEVRGQGVGTATVAALCRRLLDTVDVISLNVKKDNLAAIRLYEKLGFVRIAEFDETPFVTRDRPGPAGVTEHTPNSEATEASRS